MQTKQIISGIAVSATFLLSGSALAGPCTFGSSVLITGMMPAAGVNVATPASINPGIQSTSCYGVNTGNNVAAESDLQDQYGNFNIGADEAGLLNGGSPGGTTYFDPYYLPGLDNLSHNWNTAIYGSNVSTATQSTLTQVNADGTPDPGWVYIGKNGSESTIQKNGNSLNLTNVLDFTFTGLGGTSGTWGLNLDANIVQEVQSILGASVFDHLAFLVKAGNNYAIYDFDFTVIAPNLNLSVPNSFTGTWSTTDFRNQNNNMQGISDFSVWARDPFSEESQIPEPGSLALTGIALFGLGALRRRRAR